MQSSPQNGEKTNFSVINYDCDFSQQPRKQPHFQPQKQPQKQPRKKVENTQCFQGLRDFGNGLNNHKNNHNSNHENNHGFNHGKETEKRKEEEKEKRSKKEKEEEKRKDKEKYYGGGGDASARENADDGGDEASASDVIEAACGFDALDALLLSMPAEGRRKFEETADLLFSRFFGRMPSAFDRLSLLDALRWSLYGDGPFTLSGEDIELLTLVFKAAADAGHSDLAYLNGIFRRLRQRGIRTPSDFYAFELSRSGIL